MIESMLPGAERRVVEIQKRINLLAMQVGLIEEQNRGHLNLPPRIAAKFRSESIKARALMDDLKAELRIAIRRAESVSPGCTPALLKMAKV